MSKSSRPNLRILAPAAAAMALLALFGLFIWAHFQFFAHGYVTFVKNGIESHWGRRFAISLIFGEIVPFYLGMGYGLWLLTYAWGAWLSPVFRAGWRFRDAFILTMLAFGWIHVCLWWLVPSTVGVVPGLGAAPFWLSLSGLPLIMLAGLGWRIRKGYGWRALPMAGGWLLLWTGVALLPLALARPAQARPTHDKPTQALILGIDGLRQDVAYEKGLHHFEGVHFPNVYVPLPATRLHYSLIWGGDPRHYSVGHALPSLEELVGERGYELLSEAKRRGQKIRFFIDDGGTIGLSNRSTEFDRVEMPARGWENFVNSNLAVHLPIYASWLDVIRVFPTTNPWSDPVAGLRKALEEGRGADVVMFHTCLNHHPLYLKRWEMNKLGTWWDITPNKLLPYFSWVQFKEKDFPWDARRDPLGAYRIRMETILTAWAPIWNELSRDPQYSQADRVLFADHGERFYQVAEGVRIQGYHGYNLDPWELRVPMVLAGPGAQGEPPTAAVSTLELREALGERLFQGRHMTPASFGRMPFAPSRYHTINTEMFRKVEEQYKEIKASAIIKSAFILPEGAWATQYEKTAEERGLDVSVAFAKEDILDIYKPLEKGGAHHFQFKGYQLIGEEMIDEPTFKTKKSEVEKVFFSRPKSFSPVWNQGNSTHEIIELLKSTQREPPSSKTN